MSTMESIAFESIRATDDAMIAGEPTCMCREGAYLGAQMLGTPIRCERCKRIAWTVDIRIIRELKDALDAAESERDSLAVQLDEALGKVARVEAERDTWATQSTTNATALYADNGWKASDDTTER